MTDRPQVDYTTRRSQAYVDRSRFFEHTTRRQSVTRQAIGNDFISPIRKPAPIGVLSQTAQDETVNVANPAKQLPTQVKTAKIGFPMHKLLVGMAFVVFAVGILVSAQTLLTNNDARNQVNALSKATENGDSSAPSETKPTSSAVSGYNVAPDLPRYIKIPKLEVMARVQQVGVNANGALGTPKNIYDAAWYTGSSKPGEAGATLIDGHVSGWTDHGVFYGLKKLVAGDVVQIEKGNGDVLNYRVVRSQVYDEDNVDMSAALTPITSGKYGLNIITCTGKVKPGTNDFTKRIIVFAEQI